MQTLHTAALLLGLAAALPAQSSATAREQLQELLTSTHAEHGFPGAVLAWATAGGGGGAVAVGAQDKDGAHPLETGDRLLSGSVGKTYVAALALLLVAEGKLDLEDHLSDHLGDEDWFADLPNGDEITLRQLLRHRTGLPRYVFREDFTAALVQEPERLWPPRELVGYVLGEDPLFPAGSSWAYSDTNYLLVGMVLEKVTERSYFELLRERVLQPLELENTIPVEGWNIPGLANGFSHGLLGGYEGPSLVGGRYVVNPAFEWCGGGIASTARDLARWGQALYGGDLLAPEQQEMLVDGVPVRPGAPISYALATFLRRSPRLGPVQGHSGIMLGYLAEVAHYPDLELTVAMQCNTDDARSLGQPLRLYLDQAASVLAAR